MNSILKNKKASLPLPILLLVVLTIVLFIYTLFKMGSGVRGLENRIATNLIENVYAIEEQINFRLSEGASQRDIENEFASVGVRIQGQEPIITKNYTIGAGSSMKTINITYSTRANIPAPQPIVNQQGNIDRIWFDILTPSGGRQIVTSVQEHVGVMLHVNWNYGQLNCNRVRVYINSPGLLRRLIAIFNPGASIEYLGNELEKGEHRIEAICITGEINNIQEIQSTKKEATLRVT
jgi:hypothetical protein